MQQKDIYESLEHLHNDFELAEYLKKNVKARATGLDYDSRNYKILREKFLKDSNTKELLSDFIRRNRDIQQFWLFIRDKFPTYAERRSFIDESFENLLTYLEERELSKGASLIKLSSVKKAMTIDEELNNLIEEAKNRFEVPKDRKIALEKLWDAFERIKTYYGDNKKLSAEELVKKISSDFDYEFIKNEFKELTKIGNNYNIRHHEKDKLLIKEDKYIEYLFFRMFALLNLCIANIQEKDIEGEDIPF